MSKENGVLFKKKKKNPHQTVGVLCLCRTCGKFFCICSWRVASQESEHTKREGENTVFLKKNYPKYCFCVWFPFIYLFLFAMDVSVVREEERGEIIRGSGCVSFPFPPVSLLPRHLFVGSFTFRGYPLTVWRLPTVLENACSVLSSRRGPNLSVLSRLRVLALL